jgi:bifunctional non-homologous end joining protein LigD
VFDGDRPSFAMLQRRMLVARPAAGLVAAVPVTYVAFDLLWQARSLLRSAYAQRRALLDGLSAAKDRPARIVSVASELTACSTSL